MYQDPVATVGCTMLLLLLLLLIIANTAITLDMHLVLLLPTMACTTIRMKDQDRPPWGIVELTCIRIIPVKLTAVVPCFLRAYDATVLPNHHPPTTSRWPLTSR